MALSTKWCNAAYDPNLLNQKNIMSYFCNKTNPFYSSQSNNERVNMSKGVTVDITQLQGDEYSLWHDQEPILFIIVKSRRLSPTKTTPLTYYYVIHGEVMQVPDIASVASARLQAVMYNMNQSMSLLSKQVKYNPTNGAYLWHKDDKSSVQSDIHESDTSVNIKEEPARGTQFQAINMRDVLRDWAGKFPITRSASPPQSIQNILFGATPASHQQKLGAPRHNTLISNTPSTTTAAVAGGNTPASSSDQPPHKKMRV